MNIKYFEGVNSLEELKQVYRKLSKKYHPDLNHDKDTTDIMKAINVEYEYLESRLFSSKEEKAGHQQDDNFRDIMDIVVKFDDSITIDIVGSWIWVHGAYNDMKKVIDTLKELGFKYSASNKKWFKAPYELQKRRKATTYEYKTSKYGCVSSKGKKQATQAIQ